MKRALLIILLVSFANAEFSYRGYLKSFYITHKIPGYMNTDEQYSSQGIQRVRGEVSWKPVSAVSLNAAYSLAANTGGSTLTDMDALEMDPPRGWRFDDMQNPVYPHNDSVSPNFQLTQNLDRLYLRLSASFGDLYIGRQAIAWGTARAFPCVDVVAPFSFDALDTEERQGVDAAMIRIPIGLMNTVEAGYIAGQDFDFDASAVYIHPKFYVLNTDIGLTAMKHRKNMLYGVDIARTIGGAGVWAEASWHDVERAELDLSGFVSIPENLRWIASKKKTEFGRISGGADYSFGGELYTSLEAHFNGAGYAETDVLGMQLNPAFLVGIVSNTGRLYLAPMASYQITPLLTGTLQAYWNLDDMSSALVPMLEFSAAQNVNIGAGAYIGVGEGDFVTEYGSYPDMGYINMRWYF